MFQANWNPSKCMHFCNEFLNRVKNTVTKDYDECIYKFEQKPGCNVELEILSGSSEYSFLPKWYIDETIRLKRKKVGCT